MENQYWWIIGGIIFIIIIGFLTKVTETEWVSWQEIEKDKWFGRKVHCESPLPHMCQRTCYGFGTIEYGLCSNVGKEVIIEKLNKRVMCPNWGCDFEIMNNQCTEICKI